MIKLNAPARIAVAGIAALTLVSAAISANTMEESYWYAAGDRTVPEGQLWTTGYSTSEDPACWNSAYPDGPNDLPPCGVEPVPDEFTVRLNFEFDRYQVPADVVNADELARLDDYIADVLATPADEFLTVTGHTDAVGSDEYNMALGMRRATAVRDYMIAQGISADRIAAPVSEGKRVMLPDFPPDSVYQRRVKILSEVN